MNPCGKFVERISAKLDGQLTAEEERELEAHLAVCPACRALESQLAAIHAAFPQIEEVSTPEGFVDRVMDQIRAREGQGAKVAPLFKRPQIQALASLAACAVLCVGLYRGRPTARLWERRKERRTGSVPPGGQHRPERPGRGAV